MHISIICYIFVPTKTKDMDNRLYRLLNIISRLSYQASKFMNDSMYNNKLTIKDRINYREILKVRESRILIYITENYGKEKD